jgi:NADH-quinone oxidoreductase subunit G
MSGGKEVTLIIDGREVAATEGEMLHDAAKRGDVEIPVFCYEPKLGEPVGACRMCLVEIEGIPKLQTSCSTPVRDGMVVHTRTDQVKHAQSAVVEFLLVNHPLDCPVCDKGGECPLQDITMGWGPGKTRFTDDKRHFQKPIELSPLVAIDRERCILCYRCVRFSQEVAEDEQLQLLERGDRTFVGTFDDRPYVAPFHGNITDLCPVGALTSYTYRFRARPWDIEQAGSVCTLCPSQCNVSFTVRDEQVKRVVARDNPEVDDGWLCDRGRYGFEMFTAEERVTEPRLRGGAKVEWAEAIAKAAEMLRAGADCAINHPIGGSNAQSAKGGGVAAIVGDASNEEGYLVQRIVREALGSENVAAGRAYGILRHDFVDISQPALSARVRDIDAADAILVIGTDPLHDSPILDLRIRKAMRRNGTKLAVATKRPTALDGGADVAVRYIPNAAGAFLDDLVKSLSGSGDGESHSGADASQIADVLRGAEKVVVVWGENVAWGDGRGLLALAEALNIAEHNGAGMLEVPELANARGLREVGCMPEAGPGLSQRFGGRDVAGIRDGLESGEIESLILFGVDPIRDFPDTAGWKSALAAADHVVCFSMFSNETTALADVVFPLESHAEKDGTVTHPDGRLQRVRPSASRPGNIRPNWGVLAELSLVLGLDTGISSQPSAFAALAGEVPFYSGITDGDIGGRGIRWQEGPSAAAFPTRPEPTGDPVEFVFESKPGETTYTEVRSYDLDVSTYRDLWVGPITELNPPLRFLSPRQTLELSPGDAERLKLEGGDEVTVSQNGSTIRARVAVRERMCDGTGFLIEGTASDNANALHDLAGTIAAKIAKVGE